MRALWAPDARLHQSPSPPALCGLAPRSVEIHFLALLLIFGMVFFGFILPVFQLISRRMRDRKFVVRLGTPWKFSDAEHRWDVLLSFVSFVVTLGISLFVLDLIFPLREAGQ
jgi:hypothetical protein